MLNIEAYNEIEYDSHDLVVTQNKELFNYLLLGQDKWFSIIL